MRSAGGAGRLGWASSAADVLRAAASLRLTVLLLLVLVAGALAVTGDAELAGTWVLSVPLAALAINLAAAIATNGVFRRQLPLLLFHLALIALLLLAALSRLMVLHGRAEVTSGTPFHGLMQVDAGPWHIGALDQVMFVSEGFEIEYLPGPQTDLLRSRLRWRDEAGREQVGLAERNRPITLHGYRIAPSSNKGFAPVLRWQRNGGASVVASVHLPPYPAQALKQSVTWRPDGAQEELWIHLDVADDLIPRDRRSQFRLPDRQTLVVRVGGHRFELDPGESLEVAGGRLEYRELRTWMGYTFFHDWTIPWMLAACVIAVISLSWHFWRKYAATPWNREAGIGT